jgi:hypothetical protein
MINRFSRKAESPVIQVDKAEPPYRILISFGNPEMGRILFRMITRIANGTTHIKITAFHLFTGNLFTRYKLDDIERESFLPILNESKKSGIPVETVFKISDDITDDIITESKNGYDLLLIGIGQSIYEGSTLGRLLGIGARIFNPGWLFRRFRPKTIPLFNVPDQRTYEIINRCRIPAGILINLNLSEIRSILIIRNDNSRLAEFVPGLMQNKEISISYSNESEVSGKSLQGVDLIVISLQDWLKLNQEYRSNLTSVLVVKA